uniref:Uncharacterized protein n=1 Tax=Lygus hesperus TaxID=30085 RepID=A0A0A9WMR4_LYGHE
MHNTNDSNHTNASTTSGVEANSTEGNNTVNKQVVILDDRLIAILAGSVGGIRGVHIVETFPPPPTLERLEAFAQRDDEHEENTITYANKENNGTLMRKVKKAIKNVIHNNSNTTDNLTNSNARPMRSK